MEPRPIQRDLMIATEIIALSHHEEDDPFQARTASTIIMVLGPQGVLTDNISLNADIFYYILKYSIKF